MRVINIDGRLGLIREGGYIDVAVESDGLFSSDIQAAYSRWSELEDWAETHTQGEVHAIDPATVGAPAPAPRQVFAIGLNYRDHAEEANLEIPTDSMVVFTKFPSSITGPNDQISLPKGSVDFETELVVVIGKQAHQVEPEDGWNYVAGLTMGQDISERELQLSGSNPQFNLGKSFPGFSPMGPVVVTPDEFPDRDDVQIGCAINGEVMQQSRTSNMIFSVPQIISYLSSVVTLLPGDVIFTGTPAGIGFARNPKRLLSHGDELRTHAEDIGHMLNRFVETTA